MIARSIHRWRAVAICALLATATLAGFSPLLNSDFIRLDDEDYVTRNPHVLTGLTWANAKWALRSGYASNWHPLTWLSHMADVQFFGLKAGAHHLTNILLHAGNSVLLFLLLRRLTGAEWRSAMVAAFFAFHPLHVESVAWIAERKDLLSGLFFLLTIWAYADYVQSKVQRPENKVFSIQYSVFRLGRWVVSSEGAWYVLALGLYALGLMSKPMLVSSPLVLLFLDYWPLGRVVTDQHQSQATPPSSVDPLIHQSINPPNQQLPHSTTPSFHRSIFPSLRLLAEKLPFVALAAASSIITLLVQARGDSVAPTRVLSTSARLINAVVSYGEYLWKMVWPVDLAVFYPHPGLLPPGLGHRPGWEAVVAVAAVTGISICALSLRSQRRWFATGWCWYIVMLLPVIGLVQVGRQALADRYFYLPSIGIFVCIVWGAFELLKKLRWGKGLLVAGSCAATLSCLALTYRQAGYWHDNLTLFKHALAVTQNNSLAHYNLGIEFNAQEHYEQAISQFQAAIAAAPSDPFSHVGYGDALSALGRPAEAIEQYQAALRLYPENATACHNLGVMFEALGRREEAVEQFQKALRLKPDYAQAHYNLGFIFARNGQLEGAAAHFTSALSLNPAYTDAMVGLGNVRLMQGKLPESQFAFQELVKLSPTNAEAHAGLGEVLRRRGQISEAIPHFADAVRLDPDQAVARYQLGTGLLDQRQFSQAESVFDEALRRNPSDTDALCGLAKAEMEQGKTAAAVTNLVGALRLKPNLAEALSTLAWIFATDRAAQNRNGAEAVRLAERACQVSGGGEPRFWAALDAAYAETGRFADAIRAGERTRALALAGGQSDVARSAEGRLALYAKEVPFRR